MTRTLEDCSHEYLVDRVVDGEWYLNQLVQVLTQFHPYLQPALNEIGKGAMERSDRLEAKYPVSGLILPKQH